MSLETNWQNKTEKFTLVDVNFIDKIKVTTCAVPNNFIPSPSLLKDG